MTSAPTQGASSEIEIFQDRLLSINNLSQSRVQRTVFARENGNVSCRGIVGPLPNAKAYDDTRSWHFHETLEEARASFQKPAAVVS